MPPQVDLMSRLLTLSDYEKSLWGAVKFTDYVSGLVVAGLGARTSNEQPLCFEEFHIQSPGSVQCYRAGKCSRPQGPSRCVNTTYICYSRYLDNSSSAEKMTQTLQRQTSAPVTMLNYKHFPYYAASWPADQTGAKAIRALDQLQGQENAYYATMGASFEEALETGRDVATLILKEGKGNKAQFPVRGDNSELAQVVNDDTHSSVVSVVTEFGDDDNDDDSDDNDDSNDDNNDNDNDNSKCIF